MATVKINCPTCVGTGITGSSRESICPQCGGTGTISVDNSQSLATLSAASTTPLVVTTPMAVPAAALKNLNRGK